MHGNYRCSPCRVERELPITKRVTTHTLGGEGGEKGGGEERDRIDEGKKETLSKTPQRKKKKTTHRERERERESENNANIKKKQKNR